MIGPILNPSVMIEQKALELDRGTHEAKKSYLGHTKLINDLHSILTIYTLAIQHKNQVEERVIAKYNSSLEDRVKVLNAKTTGFLGFILFLFFSSMKYMLVQQIHLLNEMRNQLRVPPIAPIPPPLQLDVAPPVQAIRLIQTGQTEENPTPLSPPIELESPQGQSSIPPAPLQRWSMPENPSGGPPPAPPMAPPPLAPPMASGIGSPPRAWKTDEIPKFRGEPEEPSIKKAPPSGKANPADVEQEKNLLSQFIKDFEKVFDPIKKNYEKFRDTKKELHEATEKCEDFQAKIDGYTAVLKKIEASREDQTVRLKFKQSSGKEIEIEATPSDASIHRKLWKSEIKMQITTLKTNIESKLEVLKEKVEECEERLGSLEELIKNEIPLDDFENWFKIKEAQLKDYRRALEYRKNWKPGVGVPKKRGSQMTTGATTGTIPDGLTLALEHMSDSEFYDSIV